MVSVLAVALPVAALAQTSPTPGPDDPRIQTVAAIPGAALRLTVFPDAPLTLILPRGERVSHFQIADSSAFVVIAVGDSDSLNIRALRPDARTGATVTTTRQSYSLQLETGRGLAAAYVVRMGGVNSIAPPIPPMPLLSVPVPALSGAYRLTGSLDLRPSQIGDDGHKTYIRWSDAQPLPAVLAIGPTGGEEVVNGYMRGDVFVIDRVYSQLVFRVDGAKAEARRAPAAAHP